MKNKITFVELHSPLFLGKKNHGTKVFNNKNGVTIEHDEERDKLTISFNGETAHVQHYNYFVENAQIVDPVAARGPGGKIKAQVSSPTDHVFAETPGRVRN